MYLALTALSIVALFALGMTLLILYSVYDRDDGARFALDLRKK